MCPDLMKHAENRSNHTKALADKLLHDGLVQRFGIKDGY